MSVSRSVKWGDLLGMRKIETVEQMTEEYKTTLMKVIYALASTEFASVEQQRWLYETADEIRIAALKDDPEVGGLAAKIDREEAYHRMHAEMWHARLKDEPRFKEAVEELWPYALGVLPKEQRAELAARVGLEEVEAVERGTHTGELAELWDEMTMVRRSAPIGSQW